jgi:hypothetical protein
MIGLLGANVARLGASGIDPDAARWIATVGSANVSGPRGRLISDTIRELKAGGVWVDLDFLPVLTAENEASALVDWKALKTMTAPVAPTFTADRGYAFNGSTQYLNTQFVPSTDCQAATGTSFMLGVYERTDFSTGTARAMGAQNTTTRTALVIPRNSSNFQASLNAANAPVGTSVTDSRGLSVAVTDGVNGTGYKNGAVGVTTALTTPGSALVSVALFMGAYNNAGSAAAFRASTLGYGLFGRNAWSATQHATFYAVMQRFMTKLGANV